MFCTKCTQIFDVWPIFGFMSSQVVEKLIKLGADLTAASENGGTPLHYAAVRNQVRYTWCWIAIMRFIISLTHAESLGSVENDLFLSFLSALPWIIELYYCL
jgi:hypothetical protein